MMTFSAELLILTLLISTRLGIVCLFTPLPILSYIPRIIRVLFVLSFSLLLALNQPFQQLDLTAINLVSDFLQEIAIGSLFAFAVYASFAVFSFAGNLMETQMGLNAIGTLNPNAAEQSRLLESFWVLLATLFFVISGGFRYFFGEVSASTLMTLNPNLLNSSFSLAKLSMVFGKTFSFGLMLAASVLFGIFLLDIILGVISRIMPQMNIYFVSLPLKMALGLWLMTLAIGLSSHLANQLTSMAIKTFFGGSYG
ncbi:flagellar biosynthetic protein FliR [Cysteiniphilum sp. QT6929]|uniref:flagellar biosynthetic protein FliR n=1 Tax=Cysteiniphilum sp. QT6929 TaxID=2975055 RepID=UPI0024B35DAC|nr:flagellar biosynthetic protein FliR [Cysteiniphilum sp. QT6929]WHN66085.1 flagellar biosynthetic protein FliR [Cysteiniphilum sp. QT6929]